MDRIRQELLTRGIAIQRTHYGLRLRMMAQKHIFPVATDGTTQEYLDMTFGMRQPTPDEVKQQERWIKPAVAGNRDRLQCARKMGVPIAAGSDMYVTTPHQNRGQASLDTLSAYAEEGMTPSYDQCR